MTDRSLSVTSKTVRLAVSRAAPALRVARPELHLRVSSPAAPTPRISQPNPGMRFVFCGPSEPPTLRISQPKPGVRFVFCGPPGPPGAAAVDLAARAAAPLGGHRAVRMADGGLIYADAFLPGGAEGVLGVTLGAVAAGEPASFRAAGQIIEPSWTWRPGPLYLGAGGTLTQTPPASGAVLEVGIALEPTVLLIRVQQEIAHGG